MEGLKKIWTNTVFNVCHGATENLRLFSKRRRDAGETAFERARRRFMNAVTEDIRSNGVREEDAGCLDGGWVIGCGHPWGQRTKREGDAGQFVCLISGTSATKCSLFCSLCWQLCTNVDNIEKPLLAFPQWLLFPAGSLFIIPQDLHKWKQSRVLVFPRGNSFCHFLRPPFSCYCPRSGSGVTSIINVCPRVAIVWQDTTKMMHAQLLLRIEINVLVAVITLRWNVATASASHSDLSGEGDEGKHRSSVHLSRGHAAENIMKKVLVCLEK